MCRQPPSRRRFLKSAGLGLSAALAAPYVFTADAEDCSRPKSKNDRLRLGAIGMRYQGSVITEKALAEADVVAVCDVDREIAEKAREQFGGKAELYEDYRRMLERSDLDVIMIGTPDHWHAAMVVDCCRAGKDVYVEKPLTLTIDEGKLLRKIVDETGRVVQVGSWERSDWRFRLACEMVRAGRVGKLEKITVTLGKNATGGPFASREPPAHLNWDLWQGQTPDVPYVPERCHYTFRWWQEYSGGQMTDWGAHHVDIAQWGAGRQHSGPVEFEGKADYPDVPGGYNVPVNFSARMRYADGVELEILDEGRNGVMFAGTEGRVFVNRGTLAGVPVDRLKDEPLEPEKYTLYDFDNPARPPRAGKLEALINHMGNFFDCVRSRKTPLSDVAGQHRSITVCHAANIAMRLGRKLRWDPESEHFVGDDEADRHLARPRRKGFEIVA